MCGENEAGVRKTAKRARVLILGIGNRLLMDEGLGSCFAEALGGLSLPEWIEVVDGGLGGLSLLDYMGDIDVLFIIDALSEEYGPPGTVEILKVNPEAIDPREALRIVTEEGSHGIVPEVLLAAASALGTLPSKSYVVGIVPQMVELGDKLTDIVLNGCVKALSLVMRILDKEGLKLNVKPQDFKERLVEVCGKP